MQFFDILTATIWVFLAVGIGYLTRVLGIINDESEKSIMRLVLIVLYPCFILSRVPSSQSLQNTSIVTMALIAGFALTCIGFFVSFYFGKVLGIDKGKGRETFCVATALQNYGFIPIPLIEALFGESSKETLGVLFVHNLGLEIAMWSIGIIILSGTMKGAFRRLINGPSVAIALGLFLNFTGLHSKIPGPINELMMQLGNCSIPISLILVGATLAGVVEREKISFHWRVVTGAMLVRFAVMPFVFLFAAWLVSASKELQTVLIVESAMPTAIFPIVLAKHFGGKPSVAVQIVIVTSIASLLLTPLLLMLGMQFFDVSGS
ncbi:MAG: AEC family transporter [Mariniblastus sp.]